MNARYSQLSDTNTDSYSNNAKARDCGLWLQALSLIVCVAMLGLAFVARAAELPKLRVRTAGVNAGHLIEDAKGRPFFMVGICPQNLIQKVRTADMNAYFKARHEQGFQRMALPVTSGKTKIAGIKIHDTRMMRLMEALLHGGTQLNGWRGADIYQTILTSFALSPDRYTLTQLRYHIRKMKAHGLLERIGSSYRYRLSDKGSKAALLFILLHKRVCGPLANSLFQHRPDEDLKPLASKVETAYHKADHAIQHVLDLLAA